MVKYVGAELRIRSANGNQRSASLTIKRRELCINTLRLHSQAEWVSHLPKEM